MSYQVLARKWRPRLFQDMVGQGHVIKALTNALDQDRLHHAYLFTGTRGVGKTTLARILAKCLNCDQGVSSTPCGECSACIGIDESRFVDLIEVDAASRARVEETRDLMDNVQYAPSIGRFKVYLIDEVHMFSNHSFNALLKTLEEPPPHVKFLLATTEPKKLPVTILSRCLQFNLKHLSADQIENQLAKILAEEGITGDDVSRRLIAMAADGSMRDALSLLDQAISHGGGELLEEQVRTMLGTVDSADLISLMTALCSNNAEAMLASIDLMAEHNADFDSILSELLTLLQKIAIAQILPENSVTQVDEDQTIRTLAATMSKEDVQLYYQIGLIGRRDLAIAPDPRNGFEMIMIRMLAFRPATEGQKPEKIIIQEPASTVTSGRQQSEQTPMSPFAGPVSGSNAWQDIIDEMALAGLVKELAGHCVLKLHTADKVHLALAPEQEHLLNKNQQDRLQKAIQTRFGDNVKVIVSVEDPEAETPAQAKARIEREKQEAAIKAMEDDPNVKAIVEAFDATLDKDSVRPGTG
jgi:DNA polymerase-3 subunit gamma/tau